MTTESEQAAADVQDQPQADEQAPEEQITDHQELEEQTESTEQDDETADDQADSEGGDDTAAAEPDGSARPDASTKAESVQKQPDDQSDTKRIEQLRAQQEELVRQEMELERSLSDLHAKAQQEDGLDPIEDFATVTKTVISAIKSLRQQHQSIQAYIETQQRASEAERLWSDWSAKTGISIDEGKKWWAEELNRYKSQYSGEALQAAARVAWEQRVERVLAGKTQVKSAPNNTAKTVRVTSGGARVSPPGSATAKSPPPKPATIEEKMARGDYGPLYLLGT